jgi:hypothetical protein
LGELLLAEFSQSTVGPIELELELEFDLEFDLEFELFGFETGRHEREEIEAE